MFERIRRALAPRRFALGVWFVVCIICLAGLGLSTWGCEDDDENNSGGSSSSYGIKPENYNPLRFEPNVGQADARYRFLTYAKGEVILLSSKETVFNLRGLKLGLANPRTVRAVLEGALESGGEETQERLSGQVNYLIGNDRRQWHTDIPTFGRVTFHTVYPGIDAVYHGTRSSLENDYVVHPGGDPTRIRIRFEGADELRIKSDGSLAVYAGTQTLRWAKPYVYQRGEHGELNKVEGRFSMPEKNVVAFELGVYEAQRDLVIDPPLTYATYFGGPNTEGAARVVADANGNAYMVGGTDTPSFMSTSGTYVTNNTGSNGNVLVAKLSADGKTMIYETHIGGSLAEVAFGAALDSSNNLYVTGMTTSADFPLFPSKTANNLTTGNITDPLNCFVLELNATGSALVYSSILGGGQADGCSSVAVDSAGNAYVAGGTASTDFPLVNAAQSAPATQFGSPSGSAFVAKLAPGGAKLLYSTYYGGSGDNSAVAIAVDSGGNAYFTGFTTSSSFPTTAGALQTTFGGSGGQNSLLGAAFPTGNFFNYSVASTFGDAYVVKLNSSGQKVYSTYLGGEKDDIGYSIAVDSKGDAYVGGQTLSSHFPTQNAFQSSYGGAGGNSQAAGGDGFIAEIDPTGSTLLFSSYIGGQQDDRVLGIALDSSNNIYLTGQTQSQNFPTAGQQLQTGYAGDKDTFFPMGDVFVAEVGASSHALTLSTFLGGSYGEWAGGIAIDGLGGIIIAGATDSPDFPTTAGVYQKNYAGSDAVVLGVAVGDAFLAKIGGGVPAVAIQGISNAASYASGSIAPGEAVLIAGAGIGPTSLNTAQLTASGAVSTNVANTTFTFNGYPAPIVYVSQQYSSVIVPYEVAGSSSAQVIATVNGQTSPPFTVPVVAALPGIFSANASGGGQGAFLNQNLTPNTAQNPAARGSTVVLFLTGEGQTNPNGVDGQVTASHISPALQPVTVSFGGVPATNYPFVGEAPSEVAGVMQINVTVPTGAPAGSAVPVTVTLGNTYTTQSGITIALQ